jgi:cytochrome c peroxidase
MKLKVVVLGALLFTIGCVKQTPLPTQDTSPYNLEYGELTTPDIEGDNPLTVQGVQLGRMLFYENRLSGDNSISCASCHRQEHAFSDTAQFSIGIHGDAGHRQAMSAVNMLWNTNGYFWDGRAEKLREQSLMPIQDPLEMDETLENVVEKLEQDTMYTNQFLRAFGTSQPTDHLISLALEQFMNSIVSYRSKYDKYLAGEASLTESEERGKDLFFEEYNPFFPDQSGADCGHCHSGKNFDSPTYMNNGTDSLNSDLGRYTVTGDTADIGLMKTTTLRNIALTPPYMHDGIFSTLREVIDHYDHGLQNSSTLDAALAMTMGTGLMLSEQDKDDLEAFLHTLTDYELITDERYSSPF